MEGRIQEIIYGGKGSFTAGLEKDKRFPPFSQTGYGTGEGLCGWNCRHSFGSGDGVNNPYKDIQTADNYKVEQLEKRQRTLERRIRKTKREVMGMQEAVDKCKDESVKFEMQLDLDRKSYLLQRQNKAYNEFCKTNDLRTQQERLQIARWNREQAAKAREQRGGIRMRKEKKNEQMEIIQPNPRNQRVGIALSGL